MSLQAFITLAAFVAAAAAQSLTVNTPTSLQACLPAQITWSGTSPPFFVSIIPGGQPGGAPLKDFGKQDSTSLTWIVDQPAGTSISVQIRDGTGTLNYSDKVTVQPSSATCPTGGSSSTSSNSSTASPTKSGSNTSGPTTSTPTNSTGKQGNASTTSTTSTSPASTSPAATGASTSDACRTIPAFFALGLSAAIAAFA